MGELIEIARPDGERLPAYQARAADDAPSVVVVQEYWGLNDQIKSVADRVARTGLNAIVPDLYRGRVASDADEASHLMEHLDFPNALQDVDACLAQLKTNGRDAAVMGFCMGGVLTIMAGVHLARCDAGVCFYGIPPAAAADPAQIRCRIQFHFADKDHWCTPNTVDTLEEVMVGAHVPHQLFRYDAAHAFMNAARPDVFDAEKSELAWTRADSFLFGALR